MLKKFIWLITAALFFHSSLFAQVIEEVIVTAQKREQSIQDVGISITAYTGDQLTRLGLYESTDIIGTTPALYSGGNTAGQFQQFSIRGVTQNDVSDIVEPPNAVYINEAYMPAAQTQIFAMFDLERVEVLKGPQGTLFGRNATGGLVHYIPRKPADEPEGYLDATYGSYDQVRFEGAVSGPVSGDLSYRLSGVYSRHDEIYDNSYPFGQPVIPGIGPLAGSLAGANDFWNEDQWAFRGQLLWEANDTVEIHVSGFASGSVSSIAAYQTVATTEIRDEQGRHINSIFSADDPQGCEAILSTTGACTDSLSGSPGTVFRPVVGGDAFGYIDPDGDGLFTSSDFAVDDLNELDSHGVTGKLTWNLNNMTLTSISHYVQSGKLLGLDVDASPAPTSVLTSGPTQTDSFTQEIRLNGASDHMNWVAGFYYLNNEVNYVVSFGLGPTAPITLFVVPGQTPTDGIAKSDLKTDSYSAFGQVEYALSQKFSVIAGVRVIQEEQEFDYSAFTTLNLDDAETDLDIVLFHARPNYSDENSETLWTAKLQLNYRPNENWLLYAGVNRGSKAGSYNTQANDPSPTLAPETVPFDEEVLLAYEAGFKSTLGGGKVQFNASAYYYDYKDYQAFSFIPGTVSGATTNQEAEYMGFEVEMMATPVENLLLSMNVSYIDAEVKDVGISAGIFRDVEPAFTPEFKFSGLVRYEWPDSIAGGTIAAQVHGNYATSAYYNLQNFDSQKMDAHGLINARLSWMSADGHWRLAFFARNINDERNGIQGFDLSSLCGCSEIAYGKPQWFGGSLRYNW